MAVTTERVAGSTAIRPFTVETFRRGARPRRPLRRLRAAGAAQQRAPHGVPVAAL